MNRDAETFPDTTRTFEPTSYAMRFEPTSRVPVDTLEAEMVFEPDTGPKNPEALTVLAPSTLPYRFAPDTVLAKADTAP